MPIAHIKHDEHRPKFYWSLITLDYRKEVINFLSSSIFHKSIGNDDGDDFDACSNESIYQNLFNPKDKYNLPLQIGRQAN